MRTSRLQHGQFTLLLRRPCAVHLRLVSRVSFWDIPERCVRRSPGLPAVTDVWWRVFRSPFMQEIIAFTPFRSDPVVKKSVSSEWGRCTRALCVFAVYSREIIRSRKKKNLRFYFTRSNFKNIRTNNEITRARLKL